MKGGSKVGPEVDDKALLDIPIDTLDVVVTQRSLAGKTLKELGTLESMRGSFLRRFMRAGQEMPIAAESVIDRGDVLQLVGSKPDVDRAAKELGYPDRPTTSTNMVFVGTGIVLGGFVGLLSVTIGNIPLTLTASGGALVMGLVFGWLRSVYPFFGRIPEPAIWIFDTLGLCVFIGVVGLNAGPSFVAGLQKTGLSLVLVGLVAALLPHTDWDSLWTFRLEDGTAHRARRLRRSRDDHRGPARHSGRGGQQHSGAGLYRALRHRQHSADGLGARPHRVDVDWDVVTTSADQTAIQRVPHYSRLWKAAIGLALFAAFAAVGATVTEPKRVLLVHSFGNDFAPFLTFRTELAKRLGEPVDLHEVPLLTGRNGASPEDAPFVDYLLGLFPQRPPDLVVTIGGPALRLAQRQRQRLFPQAPMLFASADQRHVQDAALTANDTVVAIKIDFPGLIENILEVLPETKQVAVVLGASPLEKFWAEELQREFQPFMQRINFVWLNQLSFEEIKQRVAVLPPRSAILYGTLLVDAAGVPHAREVALKGLHSAANAPMFGIYSEQLGQGVVGGRFISNQELGRNAADVAIRILRGEAPGAIRTPPLTAGMPVYDSRELRRWGISEASLPTGSVVQFREPTVWQQYGSYITAGITIFALQSALIVTLFWQRARRRRAEHEAASSSGRLLTVHENERRRLARELHDDVTQRLAALAIEAARVDSGTGQPTERHAVNPRWAGETERGCPCVVVPATSFRDR